MGLALPFVSLGFGRLGNLEDSLLWNLKIAETPRWRPKQSMGKFYTSKSWISTGAVKNTNLKDMGEVLWVEDPVEEGVGHGVPEEVQPLSL